MMAPRATRAWHALIALVALAWRAHADAPGGAAEDALAQAAAQAYSQGAAHYNRREWLPAIDQLERALEHATVLDGRPPGTAQTLATLRTFIATAREKQAEAMGVVERVPTPEEPQYSAAMKALSGENPLVAELDALRTARDATAEGFLKLAMRAFGEERAHAIAARAFRAGALRAARHEPAVGGFVAHGLPYLLMHAMQHSCDFAGVEAWTPVLERAMRMAINCTRDLPACASDRRLSPALTPAALTAANAYTVLTNPVAFRQPELLLAFLRSRYALEGPPARPRPGAFAAAHAGALASASAAHAADAASRPGARLFHFGYITGVPSAHVTYELVGLLPLLHSARSVQLSWYTLHEGDAAELRRMGWFRTVRVIDLARISPDEAAAAVRADGTQVLVDLDAHIEVSATKPSAMLMRAPAPVACQWLGWAGTSGHPAVAYAGLDLEIAPPRLKHLFSERLVLLPGAYQANNHALKWNHAVGRSERGVAQRAEHLRALIAAQRGVRDAVSEAESEAAAAAAEARRLARAPVACNFNQLFKLSDDVYADWRNVLRRARPASIVQGAGVSFSRTISQNDAPTNLHALAYAVGADADSHLRFARPLQKGDHLARMSVMCDLALDTLHYNSHTTGADALWTATPLLTLRGTTMASRVGYSLSRAAGVADTMVHSHKEYEDFAALLLGAGRRAGAWHR